MVRLRSSVCGLDGPHVDPFRTLNRIHCFENVTAILFLVAISEYDQMLYEDESINRMQEALVLFDSICNSRWFVRTSIILFLNKVSPASTTLCGASGQKLTRSGHAQIDLFREKLPRSPIADYFPDYTGGSDLQAACDYFSSRFVSLNQSNAKQIYVHFTCATETTQIRFVLSAVNDIIIQLNLRCVFKPSSPSRRGFACLTERLRTTGIAASCDLPSASCSSHWDHSTLLFCTTTAALSVHLFSYRSLYCLFSTPSWHRLFPPSSSLEIPWPFFVSDTLRGNFVHEYLLVSRVRVRAVTTTIGTTSEVRLGKSGNYVRRATMSECSASRARSRAVLPSSSCHGQAVRLAHSNALRLQVLLTFSERSAPAPRSTLTASVCPANAPSDSEQRSTALCKALRARTSIGR